MRTSNWAKWSGGVALIAAMIGTPAVAEEMWPAPILEDTLGSVDPIVNDYSGQLPGTYTVQVLGARGCGVSLLWQDQVDETTTTIAHEVNSYIKKPGWYTIRALDYYTWPGTHVLVTPEDGVIEGPQVLNRVVKNGQPWELRIDWSEAMCGTYFIEIRPLPINAESGDRFKTMFFNRQETISSSIEMTPHTQVGKYLVTISGEYGEMEEEPVGTGDLPTYSFQYRVRR